MKKLIAILMMTFALVHWCHAQPSAPRIPMSAVDSAIVNEITTQFGHAGAAKIIEYTYNKFKSGWTEYHNELSGSVYGMIEDKYGSQYVSTVLRNQSDLTASAGAIRQSLGLYDLRSAIRFAQMLSLFVDYDQSGYTVHSIEGQMPPVEGVEIRNARQVQGVLIGIDASINEAYVRDAYGNVRTCNIYTVR